MSAPTVLVLDDEADLRALYTTALERRGWQVMATANVAQARAALLTNPNIAAVLTDMRLPDGTGMDLLTHIKTHHSALPVTVITAFGGVGGEGGAVEAMRAGAFDYLAKPVDLTVLRERVAQMLANAKPQQANHAPSAANSPALERMNALLPGESEAMQHIRAQLLQWARTQAPVVLNGESGTGKELAARALHACSARAGQPFVAVNCGAIPEQLMEAEFFGVRKGAFTGATADRIGFFQAAQGGTLLLDEVGDLPLAMQVKLLRALQERQVRRVGDTQEEPVDVRIVAASHKNLAALVGSGQFRQDLYYRLNVMQLTMPALRDRGADVISIAAAYLKKHSHGGVAELSADAQAWLQSYAFPGNVRELENMLERALASAQEQTKAFIASDFSNSIQIESAPTSGRSQTNAPHSETPPYFKPPESLATDQAIDQAQAAPVQLPCDLNAHLASIERSIIVRALLQSRYNRSAAAALLGLSMRQLRYRIDQLAIEC